MNSETILLRQVNPAWIQQKVITSQVFKPTPKDDKQLSVYDGDMISAEESWNHFTSEQGLSSSGVMGVSVTEVETLELTAKSDPQPYREHAVIDFDGLNESQITKKAKLLKAYAIQRDWLYRAEVS
ncbi:hypothetical protein [Rubinisphaera sp.]|uniref:hypothetical protein n=1 Tax=Rubinisphaera sp. TaxID=2024857 RepID=UPI000C0F197E|nr:hypothetical protein [Rubinisphaera sp.]MBV09212.1 hypothetical protein [Rubinisphaera sp.]HCS53732.1 hypothetical protein [Planctomycetaceae bacterium]|tara:strand:+ start:451 stop:828 length:378 start_codon:yes stop_codon:yes gene_type:complete